MDSKFVDDVRNRWSSRDIPLAPIVLVRGRDGEMRAFLTPIATGARRGSVRRAVRR